MVIIANDTFRASPRNGTEHAFLVTEVSDHTQQQRNGIGIQDCGSGRPT
jgi:hypothetical protein